MKSYVRKFMIESRSFYPGNMMMYTFRFYASKAHGEINQNAKRICISNPELLEKKLEHLKNSPLGKKSQLATEILSGFNSKLENKYFQSAKVIFEQNFKTEEIIEKKSARIYNFDIAKHFLSLSSSSTERIEALNFVIQSLNPSIFTLREALSFQKDLIPFISSNIINESFTVDDVKKIDNLVQASSERINQLRDIRSEWESIVKIGENLDNIIDESSLIANSKVIEAYSIVDTLVAFKEFTSRFKTYGELSEKSSNSVLLTPKYPISYSKLMVQMMKKPHMNYLNLIKLSYSLKQQRKEENDNTKNSLLKEVLRVVEKNSNRSKYAIGFKPAKDLAYGDHVFFPNRWVFEKNRKKYNRQKIIPVNIKL